MEMFKTRAEARKSIGSSKSKVNKLSCPKCGGTVYEVFNKLGRPDSGQGLCPYCEQKIVRTLMPMKEHDFIRQYGTEAICIGSCSDFIW
ncbi:MAG TPA: hypothetical protein VM123_21605 [archaeon]|nr:hypothetical protein [archaeon]